MPLNHRQQKFVEGVLAGKRHAQAYRDAGYKVNSEGAAEAHASRLVRNGNVRAAIDAANDQGRKAAGLTAEWIIGGLIQEATRTGEGSSHSARVRAYELLAKRLRLFPDALEVSGVNEGPVEVKVFLPSNDRDNGPEV